jgi:hypothetical protein
MKMPERPILFACMLAMAGWSGVALNAWARPLAYLRYGDRLALHLCGEPLHGVSILSQPRPQKGLATGDFSLPCADKR